MTEARLSDGPWTYRDGIITTSAGDVVGYVSLHAASKYPEATQHITDANGRAMAAVPALIAALRVIALLNASEPLSLGDQIYAVTSARVALRNALGG